MDDYKIFTYQAEVKGCPWRLLSVLERLQIGQGWCWVNKGLIAPPPEYAASGGWALRGAQPLRGSPRALPKGRIRFPNGSGMTIEPGMTIGSGMTGG